MRTVLQEQQAHCSETRDTKEFVVTTPVADITSQTVEEASQTATKTVVANGPNVNGRTMIIGRRTKKKLNQKRKTKTSATAGTMDNTKFTITGRKAKEDRLLACRN